MFSNHDLRVNHLLKTLVLTHYTRHATRYTLHATRYTLHATRYTIRNTQTNQRSGKRLLQQFACYSSLCDHICMQTFSFLFKLQGSQFTYVSSEPHCNKSLSSFRISDWLVARRLSVISITMATTSSDTDGTRRHANTQDKIDRSGLLNTFRVSKGKKREFFDQANKSLSNGVGC